MISYFRSGGDPGWAARKPLKQSLIAKLGKIKTAVFRSVLMEVSNFYLAVPA